MSADLVDVARDDVACSCYGCEIERQRAGIRAPDRSAEPCQPENACAEHGRCWAHSEWVDTAACDPPNACVDRIACGAHGPVRVTAPTEVTS